MHIIFASREVQKNSSKREEGRGQNHGVSFRDKLASVSNFGTWSKHRLDDILVRLLSYHVWVPVLLVSLSVVLVMLVQAGHTVSWVASERVLDSRPVRLSGLRLLNAVCLISLKREFYSVHLFSQISRSQWERLKPRLPGRLCPNLTTGFGSFPPPVAIRGFTLSVSSPDER